MPRAVELHFDYLSPYAYLAHLDLSARARRGELTLTLRPVLLAALLANGGQLGPAEIPAKRRYIIRDAMRIAARRGIPLRYPRPHPFRPLSALRLSLSEVSGEEQAKVVDALWQHGWAEGGDLGDDNRLAEVLSRAGLDGPALVERTRRPEAKEALRRETDAAIARGIFGVPTMAVAGELFWGSDRVDDALERLAGRDPLDQRAADEAAAQPFGIARAQARTR